MRSHARTSLAGAILVISLLSAWSSNAEFAEVPNFAVFGYLPEYRLKDFDYEGAFQLGLTHLIYFSLEVDPVTFLPSALDRLPPLEELKRARQAADKVGGKLLLGFGGNARSKGFGPMTRTPGSRAKFLAALSEHLDTLKVDGVDYNWEYPSTEQEWHNWKDLMAETKALPLAHSTERPLVTFTMYLDPQHFKVIKHYGILEEADYLHCMAYDSRGKHSTIQFAKTGIELAQSTFGEDAAKFTLGVPFYGRNTNTMEAHNFYDLMPLIRNNKDNEVNGVFYNSQKTLKKKTELAIAGGLGGVMIWELGQDVQPFDKPQSLMHGIYNAVSKTAKAVTTAGAKEEL